MNPILIAALEIIGGIVVIALCWNETKGLGAILRPLGLLAGFCCILAGAFILLIENV